MTDDRFPADDRARPAARGGGRTTAHRECFDRARRALAGTGWEIEPPAGEAPGTRASGGGQAKCRTVAGSPDR